MKNYCLFLYEYQLKKKKKMITFCIKKKVAFFVCVIFYPFPPGEPRLHPWSGCDKYWFGINLVD